MSSFFGDEACQNAFEILKERLCTAPVLAYPKPGLGYILDCDASNVGIGSVLSQIQDGRERVIAYASKRLNEQKERYSVTRKELLAVITFVNHFRHYLLGQQFLLRTDHGSLRWLFDFKDPRGQVARWLEVLAQYDFVIQHRAGTKHGNADGLSRKDYEESKCTHSAEENESCPVCQQDKKDWEQFFEEVDDVVDLGVTVPCAQIMQTKFSEGESECLRAFTRGQAKRNKVQEVHHL